MHVPMPLGRARFNLLNQRYQRLYPDTGIPYRGRASPVPRSRVRPVKHRGQLPPYLASLAYSSYVSSNQSHVFILTRTR